MLKKTKIYTKRREKFNLRHKMFSDNFYDQVLTKLGAIYTKVKELKLDVQINDNNNLYKQIVNSISNVYSFGVERVFSNDSVKELYESMRVTKVMTQTNRYLNAFNDVLVQVTYDDVANMPKLIIRLPHSTEVEWIDNRVVSVRYFVKKIGDKGSQVERWAYWSDSEHYYIDISVAGNENIVPITDGDDSDDRLVNPLGVLPFIYMHNGWRDASFWDTYTGDDLTGGTVELAVHLTFLNHIIKSQSFKQLVGKGSNISEIKGQMTDPMSVLTLTGENTEISVLDMQSNYDELHKVIKDLSETIAISYGISPSQFRMTSQVSSGFSLQMENIKLDQFTIEQQQDFTVYEKDLFELIKIVANVYKYGIPDNSTMMIDFIEPNYPQSIQEQQEYDEKNIALGLTSPQKILMRKNPELTKEAATNIINENIKSRNEMLNKINATSDDRLNLDGLTDAT